MTDLLTVTLNPVLDAWTSVDQLQDTVKLRCTTAEYRPGGGGINVARAFTQLGGKAAALVLVGGPTGAMLLDHLRLEVDQVVDIAISGFTRQSMTVVEDHSGKEFRFVLPGPQVTQPELAAVIRYLTTQDLPPWVTLSGTLPPGAPHDFYPQLIGLLRQRGRRIALDCPGDLLAAALACGVDFVKPNEAELAQLVGRPLHGLAEKAAAAQEIATRFNLPALAVTLGAEGALWIDRLGCLYQPAPQVTAISAVGAGDSFVASAIAALASAKPADQALAQAVAAGTAAVTHHGHDLCDRLAVDAIVRRLPKGWQQSA